MENEKRIIWTSPRPPNERWVRLKRHIRTDQMVRKNNFDPNKASSEFIIAPSNPIPLLKEDQEIIYQNADIKQIPNNPSFIRPNRNRKKTA